jgi:hypothetical protein
MKLYSAIILLILTIFSIKNLNAQGERFEGGRPKIPDDLLERAKKHHD